ncbi:MAG TPA: acyl-CoA dehydrogenase family protein [Thermodesulfobacteriota bacterium]|nr:acyl-CoA dehydrogenase family protein [Thermodesulfobacteriota bacterium]
MIGFDLSPEQNSLQEKARRFSKEVILPVAAQHDRDGTFPLDIMERAHKEGFFTPLVPKKYGGQGLGLLDTCIISEELAAGCMGIYVSIFVSTLALYPIIKFGTEDQKERFLKPFCSKFSIASYCLSEVTGGSDPASMRTTAVLDGDHYLLNGAKMWVTNGGYADFYVVFATTDPSKKHKGIISLIVPSHLDGLSHGEPIDKMGQRASNTTSLTFKNVRVPKKNLLGGGGEGFKKAMAALDITRPVVAIGSVGLARTALELATQYAKRRIQFGVPIAQHQAVQFMLADMAKDIEAARLLVWKAAWLADQGVRNSKEAAIAKAFAADMAMRVTTDAVQIYGGMGYTKWHPVEKLMRDAKVIQIYEGTAQIMRLIIARRLLEETEKTL